jgi:hypothetical protein
MLSKPQIVEQYPWVIQRGLPMVIGDDLDSIMTAMLLHTVLDWQIVGVYESYQRVWFADKSLLKDAIWVDLDISHPEIRSIGHHLLYESAEEDTSSHGQSINLNMLRGVYAKRSVSGRASEHGESCSFCEEDTFPHKYPLGTVHFLAWLHDVDLKTNDEVSLALYMLSDSTWINGQSHKYRNNVLDWAKNWIPHTALDLALERNDTEEFELVMQQRIMASLRHVGLEQGRGQISSRHFQLSGYQCQFDNPNTSAHQLSELMRRIGEQLGWKPSPIPTKLSSIQGERHSELTLEAMRRKYGSISQFISDENVFSYVIPNAGKLNFTKGISL